MSTIQRTVNVPLRGNDLRNTVMAEIQQLTGQRPYSMARATVRWSGRDRIILSAGSLMNGTVDLQDGNPSTVRVSITLNGLAENYDGQVRQDLARIATRLQQGQAAPAPAQASSSTGQASSTRQRREIDWDSTFDVLDRVTGMVEDAAQQVQRQFGSGTGAPAPDPTARRPKQVREDWEPLLNPRTKDDVERERNEAILRWGAVGLGAVAIVGGILLVARSR